MEREVFEWLDGWWDIAGEIACEPKNATTDNPWRWDGYVYRSTCLPDALNGVDIKPLKRFLTAIVALWDESRINGPKPTERELHALSSEAWASYQTLQNRRSLEQEVEPAEPPKESSPLVVRTPSEWQSMLIWSARTWTRRREDFPECFLDVPGENACSIREPELSLWLASAANKSRSPFEKP